MNFSNILFASSSKGVSGFNPGGFDIERIEDGVMH